MNEQKEIEKSVTNEDLMIVAQRIIGKLHEGISQLDKEAQSIMLKKHAEANIEIAIGVISRWLNRDPESLSVDEMMKNHELIEQQFSNKGASITRENNIITWRGNVAHCYDPLIEFGTVQPYPAFCDHCNKYFFEGLYGIAHKGPLKVECLKSVIRGDDECITRVELL